MTADAMSGAGGMRDSDRTWLRIDHAFSSNVVQTGQVRRCAATSSGTVPAPSMASEKTRWATSHLTADLVLFQLVHQRGPGAMHPALDRPDASAEDRGGFLVGEAQDLDHHEGLAQRHRQPADSLVDPGTLVGIGCVERSPILLRDPILIRGGGLSAGSALGVHPAVS